LRLGELSHHYTEQRGSLASHILWLVDITTKTTAIPSTSHYIDIDTHTNTNTNTNTRPVLISFEAGPQTTSPYHTSATPRTSRRPIRTSVTTYGITIHVTLLSLRNCHTKCWCGFLHCTYLGGVLRMYRMGWDGWDREKLLCYVSCQ